MTALLDVQNLRVLFPTPGGLQPAVDGLNFTLRAGERLALVGESGSGKTASALAIPGLINARLEGRILFNGMDLISAPAEKLRSVRGGQIGVVFQDPLSSLDPVMTVGNQVTEAIVIRGSGRAAARRKAIELLGRVGIKDADRRIDDYPHQFSGGMRQRVAIAAALIADPALLIADEPTTALDVRVQAQVLDLLRELGEERGLAILFITHDIGIVAGFADRVIVMYAGIAAEAATTHDLFNRAGHPYSWGLLGAVPRLTGDVPRRLPSIPGQLPGLGLRPTGCPFHPRCQFAQAVCTTDRPKLTTSGVSDHSAACHFFGSLPRPDHLLSDRENAEPT